MLVNQNIIFFRQLQHAGSFLNKPVNEIDT
jgi:hypothetical protein